MTLYDYLFKLIFKIQNIVLQQPSFPNATVTVTEGEALKLTCITRNIQDITTSMILDPNGVPVAAVFGVFTVPNVTRSYAGTYTCIVTSTLDNSTVNETSEVIVECKLNFMASLNNDVTCSYRPVSRFMERGPGCAYSIICGPVNIIHNVVNNYMIIMCMGP